MHFLSKQFGYIVYKSARVCLQAKPVLQMRTLPSIKQMGISHIDILKRNVVGKKNDGAPCLLCYLSIPWQNGHNGQRVNVAAQSTLQQTRAREGQTRAFTTAAAMYVMVYCVDRSLLSGSDWRVCMLPRPLC